MTKNTDNRLAAILYTRICNSTIKSKSQIADKYFPEIFNSVINNFNGIIQKETSATFSAITTAVRCAIELQRTIRRWNLYHPVNENIKLGIILDVCEVDTKNIFSIVTQFC